MRIEKSDGTFSNVPLDKLSLADRTYVKELIRVDPEAKVIIGKVVEVIDGDTITLLDEEKQQHKIRLEGIDAPENGQDFGTAAKKALSQKVFNSTPWTEWRGKDKYDRILGHIYLDGRHINLEMVADGYAWHYKEYSKDPRLANAEIVARHRKVAIWSAAGAVPPWDFRRGTRESVPQTKATTSAIQGNGASSKQPSQSDTVYVTRTGTKYHRSGCRHLSKSVIPLALSEARERYSPCSVCNPP